MKKIIMVAGVGRSGSTMLDLILGNSEKAFSCGEVYAWFHPWRKYHKTLSCACGDELCTIWAKLKHLSKFNFHSDLAELMGIDFIIDSSKDLLWIIDINKIYSQRSVPVFNILVYKDSLDLAFSHYKRERSIRSCKANFVQYHSRLINSGIQFVSVNYSDLVNAPHDTIYKLCEYIGMEYFDNKVKFWEKTHHHIFGSGGTKKQIGSMSNIKKPAYSEDFLNQKPKIEKLFGDDNKYQSIIECLKSRDINLVGSHLEEHSHDTQHKRQSIKTKPWYFLGKSKRLFWRIFPQPNMFSETSRIFKELIY